MGRLLKTSITCTLHEKEYGYEFIYYESNGDVKEAGGDGYLIHVTDAQKATDVYEKLDIIDAYVKNNGGTCVVSDPELYEE